MQYNYHYNDKENYLNKSLLTYLPRLIRSLYCTEHQHNRIKEEDDHHSIIIVYATSSSKEERRNAIVRFDSDSKSIKIDNCATRSISFDVNDFVTSTLVDVQGKKVHGFGGTTTQITKMGTISWWVEDDTGLPRNITIPNSYLVPTGTTRLLSPQHWAQQSSSMQLEHQNIQCITTAEAVKIVWHNNLYSRTIPLDKTATNVATIWTVPGYVEAMSTVQKVYSTLPKRMCFESEIIEIVSPEPYPTNTTEEGLPEEIPDSPDNLVLKDTYLDEGEETINPSTVELEISNDNNIKSIINRTEPTESSTEEKNQSLLLQWHNRLGHISMRRIQRMASLGMIPTQLARCQVPLCQACIYGMMTKRAWRTKGEVSSIRKGATGPGKHVSVDQIESPTPGLIGQIKGIPTKARYRVATIFVDGFSSLAYIHLQQTTNASETLEAKHQFENYARSFGVNITHYHADNGRFIETVWRDDVRLKGQSISYSGVGAHHQNGIVEKRIRDLQDLSRTSILFAATRWPNAISTNLWPYALLKSNVVLNNTLPPSADKSPIEKFAGVKIVPNLLNEHPFGCPVYVLDGPLQSGNKGRKWASRSRLGIYLGQSQQYSKKVSLVLSLTTGLVSPQYHVIHDNNFNTLSKLSGNIIPLSQWQNKCGFVDTQKNGPIISLSEGGTKPHVNDTNNMNNNNDNHNNRTNVPEGDIQNENEILDLDPVENETSIREQVRVPAPTERTVESVEPITTRAGRTINPPVRLQDYVVYGTLQNVREVHPETEYLHPAQYSADGTDSFAMAASTDPDTLYLHQAMQSEDRVQFLRAMKEEVESQTKNGNWVVVHKSTLPTGAQVLPAVWAMKRKRKIMDGTVYKWKARLNIDRGKQVHGIDYWETYAPVASWSTIRLVLMLAVKNKWSVRQLDFVQAFPQAPIQQEMYMEVPKGFNVHGSRTTHVLKLLKNIYGQKQAGRVWNDFLTEGLVELGFTQSKQDMCLLWRGSCIIVVYTDDTLVTGPCVDEIDKAIDNIGNRFVITSNDRVNDFLGVNIAINERDGIITFTQPQLIKSILYDLGLKEESKIKYTPAVANNILHEFKDSTNHVETWNYRSVIGKLNYLEKSSRPDISYAVHQCARFCQNPKVEHSAAVKHIGRYLLTTQDKGIVCKPDDCSVHCYADASFSGEWVKSLAEHDPTTARSRTGYIIFYSGCPIIWTSKLQTEIALSATEAEYIALSQSLREVTALFAIVREIKLIHPTINAAIPQVHCTVFEDNAGAIEMAKCPKMRPRTKHLNIKYHHFREAVANKEITIKYIRSRLQLADMLTKALVLSLYDTLRILVMGWWLIPNNKDQRECNNNNIKKNEKRKITEGSGTNNNEGSHQQHQQDTKKRSKVIQAQQPTTKRY
jgi:Reverse transcriptase (RNA-dependent DNA polymerase)/GAG-pre-integrase domain